MTPVCRPSSATPLKRPSFQLQAVIYVLLWTKGPWFTVSSASRLPVPQSDAVIFTSTPLSFHTPVWFCRVLSEYTAGPHTHLQCLTAWSWLLSQEYFELYLNCVLHYKSHPPARTPPASHADFLAITKSLDYCLCSCGKRLFIRFVVEKRWYYTYPLLAETFNANV